MELNPAHKAQVSRFISFFKGKRERLIADSEAEKNDFKTDRLLDDSIVFNKNDVAQLLDSFHQQAMATVREDMEYIINLSAVYIAQILSQAEQTGLTLDTADVAALEEKNRVEQINSYAALGQVPPARGRSGALPALVPAGAAADAITQENANLKEENRQMRDRYQSMQTQVSDLLRERAQLSGELEQVRASVQQVRQEVPQSATAYQLEQILGNTKAALDAKIQENEQMRSDLNSRLGDSSQFGQLKAIIKKKNDEVKMLRAHMTQYGIAPPNVASDGVDLVADD
mmetsp:Transcript_52546/g.97285  ORF Transcript_52546/g.97285 Transcript_52546/m.97285 type:complete len:286 (+) Transcript_52546:76-933(+)